LIVAVESFLGKFLVCVNIHHMTSCSVEAWIPGWPCKFPRSPKRDSSDRRRRIPNLQKSQLLLLHLSIKEAI
jgi:hypothetical protein